MLIYHFIKYSIPQIQIKDILINLLCIHTYFIKYNFNIPAEPKGTFSSSGFHPISCPSHTITTTPPSSRICCIFFTSFCRCVSSTYLYITIRICFLASTSGNIPSPRSPNNCYSLFSLLSNLISPSYPNLHLLSSASSRHHLIVLSSHTLFISFQIFYFDFLFALLLSHSYHLLHGIFIKQIIILYSFSFFFTFSPTQ
jgi:hypothetical protein